MARVSKKVSAAQREAENAPHRIWKTAIYARLSDFDDVLRDTESLEVQISYIKEYVNHRDDLMLLDVFADKRCTGMNFDRPESTGKLADGAGQPSGDYQLGTV